MRKHNRLPLDELQPYLCDPTRPDAGTAPINWPALFGNDRPLEIEVGSGKGQFLITAAEARPDVNFLGIEVVPKLEYYIATRAAKRSLTNIRVSRCDARVFFPTFVSSAILKTVHVYFPDPWWKARHKKRRVFTPEFADECERVLIAGGELKIASDVEEYFLVMRQLVSDRTKLRLIDSREESGPIEKEQNLTNFERKARIKGGSVWRAEFRKDA